MKMLDAKILREEFNEVKKNLEKRDNPNNRLSPKARLRFRQKGFDSAQPDRAVTPSGVEG